MAPTDHPDGHPTAATSPLDGGHPAVELVNTLWGPIGGPVDHDVLATPQDLVTLAGRLGFATADTPADPAALADAHRLRAVLDTVLRARAGGDDVPAEALAALTDRIRAALAAARLTADGGAFAWTWDPRLAQTPVHRFAHAALELLTDEAELARLRRCEGCRWMFVDHSRGTGRRWCSMAYCGTDAKKRRYVQRRRERRQAG